MTRLTLAFLALSGFLALPLLDAATKGTIVLLLAGLTCLLLKRDSAATRHCVLTVAVLMLLFMPFMSAFLPAWRVLPGWLAPPTTLSLTNAAIDPATNQAENDTKSPLDVSIVGNRFSPSLSFDATTSTTANPNSLDNAVHPMGVEPTSAIAPQLDPNSPTTSNSPNTNAWSTRLWQVLPLVWSVGAIGLLLRLAGSAWQLRRSESHCSDGSELFRSELRQALATIGLKRSVRLLLDPNQSIPIVWGLLRPRLRLPAEAVHWPKEQLQSVLLHELAHLRRHDLVELVITQLACALHWYNPLVWLAAWRLHVERERACDDLVLASGVKPSAYAEHLLQVTTKLATSSWTQVCGLAMARKSSLEGRLLAVLSRNLNRRSATLALLSIAMIGGAVIAVPVAMLGLANEPPASPQEQMEPKDQEPEPVTIEPKHESAQALFKKWQTRARTDGKIPGALIGQLGAKVNDFITQYPNEAATPQLIAVRDRFVADRDWKPTEVVAMLDEIAAIATAPIGWTSLPMEFDDFPSIKPGQPLPADLEGAAWGPPVENGLRAAWLLEPRAEQYPLGSVLKVRVLFHNAGDQPVVFRTETWHQSDQLAVRNAKGAEIKTSGTWYTGITPLVNYRLLPGEYCEVSAPGVGIGAGEYVDERSTGNLGVIIEAQAGDEIEFSCNVDAAQFIVFSRPDDPKDQRELWNKQAADRVASEAPLPQNPADREQLIRRAMLDLTGVAPTTEEIAQFVSDASPEALEHLVTRIQANAPTEPWTGKLPTGPTKFRVTPADPNAAKRPRVATTPGRYVLSDSAHLLVTQVTAGDAPRKNSAEIAFLSGDPSVASPHEPFQIELPDGLNSYAMLWVRNSSQLQIVEPDSVRTIDFSNPSSVKESRANENLSPEFQALVPEGLRKTLPKAAKDDRGVTLDPSIESQLDWGEAVNGLRGALIIGSRGEEKANGVFLVLQNVSEQTLRFRDTAKSERLNSLYVSVAGEIQFALSNDEPTMTDVILQPQEVTYLGLLRGGSEEIIAGLIEGIRKDSLQTWRAVVRMSQIGDESVWRGDLSTGETRCEVRPNLPQPKNEAARALFKFFQANARLNGDIPGGLLHRLHDKVQEFIRNNEPDAAGSPYAQKMRPLEPRFANTNDWKAADVVALLDDIAAAHTIPLETTLTHFTERQLRPGLPLPKSLESADWGQPLPSGLRVALVLEPRAEAYHLGVELKARIVFHNSGTEPVTFITDSFQQPGFSAERANGSQLEVESTHWLTLGSMAAYRLAPGDYCEVYTPGLGVGERITDRDDWKNVRAGSWIKCVAGEEVVVTPGAAALSDGRGPFLRSNVAEGAGSPGAVVQSAPEGPELSQDWWLEFITERLEREAPMPTDKTEREYLLYRVVRELYGAAPSTTEGDAFAADESPDALKNLAALLAKHPYGKQSQGLIQAGKTKFRVLPVDADADKRPRVATGPGWYSLSDSLKLSVDRRAVGERVLNEASLVYFQQGQDNLVHKVELPNGHDTWAAATLKGTTDLWIAQPGVLRRYDFKNPAAPTETQYADAALDDAPISPMLREALAPVFMKAEDDGSTPRKPAAPAAEMPSNVASDSSAASDDATGKTYTLVIAVDGTIQLENQTRTLEELNLDVVGKLEDRFVIKAPDSVPYERVAAVLLVLKSAGATNVTVSATLNDAILTAEALIGTWHGEMNGEAIRFSFHKPPAENEVHLDIYIGDATIGLITEMKVADDGQSISIYRPSGSEMELFGTLRRTVEGELRFKPTGDANSDPDSDGIILIRDRDEPASEPKQAAARELFDIWKATANDDGTIPGTFVGRLATEVRTYAKENPNLDSSMQLSKLLARFITTHDWTLSDATRLLDDVAYYSNKPIENCIDKAKLPSQDREVD